MHAAGREALRGLQLQSLGRNLLGQAAPTFDAKGIETVRRDTCGAVAKMMERSIRILFATKDLSQARSHVVFTALVSVDCPCLTALMLHVHA